MTAFDALAARIVELDPAHAPADLLGLRIADSLVAYMAARDTTEGQVLARLYGNVPWIATGTEARPSCAALALLAATIRLSEIDDIDLATCITASSIVVSTAVFLAVTLRCSVGDFTCGVRAGYATLLRYGALIGGPAARAQGIWPTLAVAPVASAATAAAMLRLPAAEIANALRLGLVRSVARIGKVIAPLPARWFIFGESVADGMMAARASADGLVIDPAREADLLSQDHIEIFARKIDDDVSRISQKTFCISRQSANATVALDAILTRERLKAADVRSVHVAAPNDYVSQITQPYCAGDRISLIASQALALAAAATMPAALLDVRRDGPIATQLQDFAARVTVNGTSEFDADYPARWPAKVTVTTMDGAQHVETRHTIKGDPGQLLSLAEIRAKLPSTSLELLEHAASAATSEQALHALGKHFS